MQGVKEMVTGPLLVNVPSEKEVTTTPPSNFPNEEESSGSSNNDITLSHQTTVMDSEVKSATSKRRAPDDSSGAVEKVVLDLETFTTNTIQVSAGIPSQNVEQTNEMDPPEKCNESQTVQECASITCTNEVDDVIKTVNGSVNDTPSIQTCENRANCGPR